MSRLPLINPAIAAAPADDLLAAVRAKLGIVPNMTRAMANSPAVLKAYLAFGTALAEGRVDKRTGELIALVVAETNGCDYCLAAHTAIGGMLKIAGDELAAAPKRSASRSAHAGDPCVRAEARRAPRPRR